ncbi:hypothetical protein FHU31_003173 [Mycolicibacterium fluoranthenivorans]|uniref:Uncharacterized protein n=1 Tax=Mycolicibacterium fluoranthenivorans TaxID=258505 RepID=A0A7X5U0M9_9MYCO|nr:hypothetical protein [Mycolicibacterium fluoranthenivorans]
MAVHFRWVDYSDPPTPKRANAPHTATFMASPALTDSVRRDVVTE